MSLDLAYNLAVKIIGPKQAECLEAAIAIDQLRWAWRPKRVNIVVLAESHVWTSRQELRSRVKLPNENATGFARFVYCLGYGEPQIVTPAVTPNKGTPQFWRMFHDMLYEPNLGYMRLLKSGEHDWQRRVQNKLDLLLEMTRAGIWLIDASVTALYQSGVGRLRLNAGDYITVLRKCWETHVGEVVSECARATRGWVVF